MKIPMRWELFNHDFQVKLIINSEIYSATAKYFKKVDNIFSVIKQIISKEFKRNCRSTFSLKRDFRNYNKHLSNSL